MGLTRLRFENVQQVVGSSELAVILLTDELRIRAISIVCDEPMTRQLVLRLQAPSQCDNLLPEALVKMLPDDYEMIIYDVNDGQYQVRLQAKNAEASVSLRMSDAVLLSVISRYPLYIEEELMKRQCIPYEEHAKGVAIPINTMDTPRLNMALQRAISDENYELASQLRDEINRRKKQ